MSSRANLCAPAHFVDEADVSVLAGTQAAVLMQRAGAPTYDGRVVELNGRPLLNFGGCSYLGLEQRPELKEGAIDAIHRFGTQFSFSRAYLESPLYSELEVLLQQMTGGHVLATPSTSLGHIAALPVLVGPEDAVLVDRQTHASVHTAVALLKGISVETLQHNRLDLVEEHVERLARTHRRVFYVIDGLYSMLGDFAPIGAIAEIMKRHPALHLYVDDAHSTSWTGTHGRGFALEALVDRERVVVALSLNKAFSAAGGALVFGNAEDRDRVRRCGGPMLFSGPIQPPMLGAAIASAKLHLDASFAGLQADLLERIRRVISLSRTLSIPLANEDLSPIFFVRSGPLEATFKLIHALRDRGFYVSPGMFPAVPHDKSGPRFTVSVHQTLDDIDGFMGALSEAARVNRIPFSDSSRHASGVRPVVNDVRAARAKGPTGS